MKLSSRGVLLSVIAATMVLWVIAFVEHHKRKPETQQHTQLKAALASAEKVRSRIDGDIARLERETLAESMIKLSHVNMFHWPGPVSEEMIVHKTYIPLREDACREALEAIISNRRFRRIFAEVSQMKEAAASEIVKRELASAITEYLPLYEAKIRSTAPLYTFEELRQLRGFPGVSFEIDNVPEGKATLVGARLKVLALVWISGMLRLNSCRDQVEQVARLAIKQRKDLYEDANLHPSYKVRMLEKASLYNRQIISSGLLGLLASNRDLEARILKAVGAEWRERMLTVYSATMTEFDVPVRQGFVKPDYSRGSLSIKCVSPLSDDSFDMVLRELHLIP